MPTSPAQRAGRPGAARLGLLAALLLLPACGAAAEDGAGAGDGGAGATAAPGTADGSTAGGAPATGTTASPSTGTAVPTSPVPTVDDTDVVTDPGYGVEDPGEKDAEPGTDDPGTDEPEEEPGPAAADVVLTWSGWDGASGQVQAGGYVTGVVETGGTCTLTLRSGGQLVTGTAPAEPDASTTVCAVGVDGAGLGSGTWTAVLDYRSDAAAGSSDEREVEVP